MKKYLAILLLAITATQAYAGEKEYTVRHCEFLIGWYADRINDCNNCKEMEGHKLSFKVSKQLNSVMKISTKSDGSTHSSVIENCKIFDENNFKCKTETEGYFIKGISSSLGILSELVVSNGKWEDTNIMRGNIDETKKLKKGEKVTPDKSQSYSCGYEIKNVFNFFK
jgi:hypothetical protein